MPVPIRFGVLLLIAGCAVSGPSGGPGGRMARISFTDRDPVGFLLLNRDSIGLHDTTIQRLVQLNLRLFRRNQALQIVIDSLTRDVRYSSRDRTVADSSALPAEIRERVQPLATQIRAQTAAVKDTAWSWLSPLQRARADSLDARQAALVRREPRT